MHRVSRSFHAFVLGWILLVSGPLVQSVSAQDASAPKSPPCLGASEVAFEWQYSCPNGKACSFTCPGSGGASSVTKLTLQLGSIPLGGDRKAFGVFYKFSTIQIPRANGFSLTTGISTLSCQVDGMDLDYSGPRKLSMRTHHGSPSMTTRRQQTSQVEREAEVQYGKADLRTNRRLCWSGHPPSAGYAMRNANDDKSPLIDLLTCIVCKVRMKIAKRRSRRE